MQQIPLTPPQKNHTFWCGSFVLWGGFEELNATIRGTVAHDGLTERNHYFHFAEK